VKPTADLIYSPQAVDSLNNFLYLSPLDHSTPPDPYIINLGVSLCKHLLLLATLGRPSLPKKLRIISAVPILSFLMRSVYLFELFKPILPQYFVYIVPAGSIPAQK
jgi:hypothetical protein